MIDLDVRRQLFAEEIQAVANVKTPALVDAFARVPRERFLDPGPWLVKSDADFGAAPRLTPDADPRHVYHNIVVAIDPARQLFNGQPSLLAMAIDALAPAAGHSVLHLGTGPGYYTSLLAHCVGPTGRVVGIEVDDALATAAQRNLASLSWVDIRHGDGSGDSLPAGESFDAILVNAGATHPLDAWLAALRPGGRMILPLTATMPAMGATIGKGVLTLVTNTGGDAWAARVVGFVAIYSAVGVRDEVRNGALGKAMARLPFPPLKRLRRDVHDAGEGCWLHADGCCFSTV